MARGPQGRTRIREKGRLKHGERGAQRTEREMASGLVEQTNRKAKEEGRPTWSNLLFRPWSMVQKGLGKAGSKVRLQVPAGLVQLGEKPPGTLLPASSHARLGLGERARLLSLRSQPHPAEQGRGK